MSSRYRRNIDDVPSAIVSLKRFHVFDDFFFHEHFSVYLFPFITIKIILSDKCLKIRFLFSSLCGKENWQIKCFIWKMCFC